jgi:hypothetical protein
MKLCNLAYLPPPRLTGAATFVDNLNACPSKYPLVSYSEHDWPGVFKLKGDPEDVKKNAVFPDGRRNPYAINNVLWLTGLRIARERGFTHALYLEHDCRVGVKHWDERVYEEFFSIGRPLIAGGNLGTYNPCNAGPEAARRWADLVSKNTRKNVPIPTYGWLRADAQAPSCVFPNGALAIYDIAWMSQLFENLENTLNVGSMTSAFDMVLGVRVWDNFQEDSYEVFGHLNSVFSGYGDVLSTEAERLSWLREGKYVGVHQVKSNATL